MNCLITPRRHLGVALTRKQLNDTVPLKGDVHIREMMNETLGRSTVEASILANTPADRDRFPRLIDAKVTSMATLGWNITGIEQVGDVFYFQSWWCRFE